MMTIGFRIIIYSEAQNLIKSDRTIFGACDYCGPEAYMNLPDWFEQYAPIYELGLPQLKNWHLVICKRGQECLCEQRF